jgi:hypothetical protein
MRNHWTFVPWEVASITAVRGEGLDPAARVEVVNPRLEALPAGASRALRGVTSNLCYTTHDEKERLSAVPPGIFHTCLVNYVTARRPNSLIWRQHRSLATPAAYRPLAGGRNDPRWQEGDHSNFDHRGSTA